MLTCKASKPKADTSKTEVQIDKIVYTLCGLKEDEITIVKDSAKK